MSQNITDILNIVEQYKKDNPTKAWIPSLKREIPLNPLTANHQKKLMEKGLGRGDYKTAFSMFLFENFSYIFDGQEIDPKTISVLDKRFIILGLRATNNDEVDLTFSDDEEDKSAGTIPIKDLIAAKKKEFTKFKVSEKVKIDNFTFTIQIPSIVREYESNRMINHLVDKLIAATKDKESVDPSSIPLVISQVYVNMIASYMTSVVVGETELNVAEMPLPDVLDFVGKLPKQLYTPLAAAINKIAEPLETFNTVKVKDGDEEKDAVFELEALLVQ